MNNLLYDTLSKALEKLIASIPISTCIYYNLARRLAVISGQQELRFTCRVIQPNTKLGAIVSYNVMTFKVTGFLAT